MLCRRSRQYWKSGNLPSFGEGSRERAVIRITWGNDTEAKNSRISVVKKMLKKVKGNILNNTVITLHGNRWLLDLLSYHKVCKC